MMANGNNGVPSYLRGDYEKFGLDPDEKQLRAKYREGHGLVPDAAQQIL